VVTDHSDGLGAFPKLLEGTPDILADPQAKAWHEAVNEGGQAAAQAQVEIVEAFSQGTVPEPVLPTVEDTTTAWESEIDFAEQFNDPGVFTAFIGYEWTSVPQGNNLHRNVIYRDGGDLAQKFLPKTSDVEFDPETLWDWMQNYEDQTGGSLLAIPHNGNLSNGLMFADETMSGTPLTADYAERRQRWEPLYEVTQIKGDGEAHPLLSTTDEFADFETWDNGNLDLSAAKDKDMLQHEYARSALKQGLKFDAELGANPFKFGLVGSTDAHTALAGVEENNFMGKLTPYEPNPDRATHIAKANDDLGLIRFGWEYASAGYAGVWARENTREALFDAM
jgi:hypothetical protein